MLKPKRITSTARPQKLINLGNGKWYYNYDIKSENKNILVLEDEKNKEVSKEVYSYIQIKFNNKPEYRECVEKIIRQYITQSQEFDLINTANRVLLNVGTEKMVPSKYLEYLDLVDEIKAKVKADFGM